MTPVTLSPAQWEVVERVVAEARSRRLEKHLEQYENCQDDEHENENVH